MNVLTHTYPHARTHARIPPPPTHTHTHMNTLTPPPPSCGPGVARASGLLRLMACLRAARDGPASALLPTLLQQPATASRGIHSSSNASSTVLMSAFAAGGLAGFKSGPGSGSWSILSPGSCIGARVAVAVAASRWMATGAATATDERRSSSKRGGGPTGSACLPGSRSEPVCLHGSRSGSGLQPESDHGTTMVAATAAAKAKSAATAKARSAAKARVAATAKATSAAATATASDPPLLLLVDCLSLAYRWAQRQSTCDVWPIGVHNGRARVMCRAEHV